MNIPLNRLYQFIENVAEQVYGDRVIIYRFDPHGSKNIQDLNQLHQNTWLEITTLPNLWCHDQEPLDHAYYQQNLRKWQDDFGSIVEGIRGYSTVHNLNYSNDTIFAKGLLLHSEQRSTNVNLYEQDGELIPVYYWSHAIIARDWFRFAEHVRQHKQVKKTFLIYNRAWSGTREYRLKFLDLLVKLGLETHCKTSVNPIEPELGIHYKIHKFKNQLWRPLNVLENFFPISTAKSHYSADFDIEDYEATDIEVVLETLFDDSRLHLTEKILRPIACGQPFILVAPHLSLEYLRGYGFKTFMHVWDERYDECIDPVERLASISDLMQQIADWDPEKRADKMAQAQAIAEYNRQHFFSKEFFDLVVGELTANMSTAFDQLNTLPVNTQWFDLWSRIVKTPELRERFHNKEDLNRFNLTTVEQALRLAENIRPLPDLPV
jgi:hypothetical protein